MKNRFARVVFRRYKALRQFSVSLQEFNILVGPNNAGKSTIIGAFRLLSEGMRIASSRKAQYYQVIDSYGYRVPLGDLPLATEAIFTDYDDSEPASIEFTLSSKDKLRLVFPENDVCYMVCEPTERSVQTPGRFKNVYDVRIGFVPVLGPVEHNEVLYQKEAARLALLTHRASRNFRNIWYHYPDDFEEFRRLVKSTWPDMDVEMPHVDHSHEKAVLHMFCPEQRYPREIFWAGFGFQVWCQMLTYIVRAREASLLVIDEPDIYLHSDLQRRLVGILKDRSPDVLIATHSTEIISEADPDDLLVVDKKNRAGKRIRNQLQLPPIFDVLGSRLNPTLTQLAKSRRVVFVEGKDFKLLSAFSRKAGMQALANQSDFAVISVEGFNPARVLDLSVGIEKTLGATVLKAVVFDRDFRSDEEVQHITERLGGYASLAHIHERKEIENYLLVPSAIQRAVETAIRRQVANSDSEDDAAGDIENVLRDVTTAMWSRVNGQFMAKRQKYLKEAHPHLDPATINERVLEEFEALWRNLEDRLRVVPGKVLLADLNRCLQRKHSVSLTVAAIMNAMRRNEIPRSMLSLLRKLDAFRRTPVPGDAGPGSDEKD